MTYNIDDILNKEVLEFVINKKTYQVKDFLVETLLENASLFEKNKEVTALRTAVANILGIKEEELIDAKVGVKALEIVFEKTMDWIQSRRKDKSEGVSPPSHP